jgi:predicted oxidoreductase
LIPSIELKAGLPAFSALVYGAWRMADGADTSAQTALKKIQLCLDMGITTFDHADIYGDYRCETLFGEALQLAPGLKHKMQIVSKCGIKLISSQYPERRVKHYDTSAAHIRYSVDNSLRRLGVERLDTLLIHRPDPFMNAYETGACLDALIQEGKIAAAGVSNFSAAEFELLQSAMRNPLVTNQLEISLLAQHTFLDGSLGQCQQRRIRPMAWSPLAGGRLFGDEAAAQRLRPALTRMAQEHGVDIDAVAIAWLLAHPAGIVPVVGTNNLQRMARLGDAFTVKFDLETWYALWTLAAGQEVP